MKFVRGLIRMEVGQIKSLKLKGFNSQEIAKVLQLNINDVNKVLSTFKEDIREDSVLLYNEMQKDLTKLILTERNKEKPDTQVLLNAIKLQADLQSKKVQLKGGISTTKISKQYIIDRDEEIYELTKTKSIEDIAKQFSMGELSIKQAIDRYELQLDDNLKKLNPSIISETIGLKREERIKILTDVFNNNLTRQQVRDIVNKIKNETRS